MRLIIHDVESIVTRGNLYAAEIIEIGAVAVDMDEDRLCYRDRFHTYVRPLHVNSIPLLTTQFTGITQEAIGQADPFPTAVQAFQSWIGHEEYFLCSWSLSDRDYFIADCRHHAVSTDWIRNYNDIQKWYGRIRGETKKRVGLARAMEQLNLTPIGVAHNAMADAVNTFRILARIYQPESPVFTLDHNDCSGIVHSQVVYADEPDQDDASGTDSPFARLRDLLTPES